eukprot:TRINITY_DN1803_c0_g3_i1.p1 TRINITY_DN1803_c0_g3~~TRINITY_DN1803_c0_g3_i1.p1  ORF type:complete len:389 (+),score=136.54 TRINITY_DN1803_c0_g3_i1:34-1167(+)
MEGHEGLDEELAVGGGVDVLNLVEGHVRKIILKRDVQSGNANATLLAADEVSENSTVYVRMTGILKKSQKVFLQHDTERTEFVMGQSEIPKGLEAGLMSMKVGERALIECSVEYGFQPGQYPKGFSPEAAPDKDEVVLYDVTLVAVDKKTDIAELSAQDKLTLAAQRKDEGNRLLADNDLQAALSQYQKGLRTIAAISFEQAEEAKLEESSIVTLKIALLTNCSLCCLKLKNYEDLFKYANHCIEIDPLNIKAHFRKAMGLKQQKELDQALTSFEFLQIADSEGKLKLDEETKNAVASQIQQIKKYKQDLDMKQKKAFSGMFDRVSLYDDKAEEEESSSSKKSSVCSRISNWLLAFIPLFVKSIFFKPQASHGKKVN